MLSTSKWAVCALVALPFPAVHAQDTRTVTEPKIPPICRTLPAHLAAPSGTLAEAEETRLDTQRIQRAIDACQPGAAVELRADGNYNAFLSGPLELKPDVTLLVVGGTTLFASRDPKVFELRPGSCGIVDTNGRGCRPLIHLKNAPNAAVMGDGVIDGRGGAKLLGQNVTWWDLAEKARSPANARQNNFRIIAAEESDNFTLYRITLRNSPNFHVIVSKTNGFTAWGVRVFSPRRSRNTDGIDPSSSSNVSILHSWISAGDDNVAIKAGSTGPATHITVAHNHFYYGHGMSIGSETSGGVSAVEVADLTIDGADNGLRIKSNATRGGLVENVSYRDVCIRNVKNPIVLETTYEHTTTGNLIPQFDNILFQNVRVFGGGKVSVDGYDAAHPVKIALDGVELSQLPPTEVHTSHVRATTGPGQVNFLLAGEDVQLDRLAGDHRVPSCDGRFPAFPKDAPNGGSDRQQASKLPPQVKRSLVVARDGSGDYTWVQQAVDALPDDGGTVTIRPGTYREVVHVRKPNVRFEGDAADPSKVVIIFDKSAGTAGGTLNSATVDVRADDFFARSITVANDFSQKNPSATQGTQAIALAVSGDRAVLRKVRMLGAQDTLYLSSKSCVGEQGPCATARQYLSDCYVEGHVDFIFGDSKAYFSNCEIHGIPHGNVMYTAQSKHYPDEDSGYVFDHCKLTADPGAKRIWLGRPWRPYSTVIFLNTDIQVPLEPAGWSEWHPGETHSLETAYYAEFQSTGPGADLTARDRHAKQLTAEEAERWHVRPFLAGADNWDPAKVR